MTDDELLFFSGKPEALALYERLKEKLAALSGEFQVKVQKTQITFHDRYGFAFVSFLPVRPASGGPKGRLTVSFGLGGRVDSPRVGAASEPYPGRWTHHVPVSGPEELDGELLGWLLEARLFAREKAQRRNR